MHKLSLLLYNKVIKNFRIFLQNGVRTACKCSRRFFPYNIWLISISKYSAFIIHSLINQSIISTYAFSSAVHFINLRILSQIIAGIQSTTVRSYFGNMKSKVCLMPSGKRRDGNSWNWENLLKRHSTWTLLPKM